MAERRAFPPPPGLTPMVTAKDLPALAWSNWFGVVAAWLQRSRVVSADVDWPSIPAGTAAFASITVAGAEVGDFAQASLDPTHVDLSVTAQVSAANTVTVWVRNHAAGAVDLAAGTTRILLEKAR